MAESNVVQLARVEIVLRRNPNNPTGPQKVRIVFLHGDLQGKNTVRDVKGPVKVGDIVKTTEHGRTAWVLEKSPSEMLSEIQHSESRHTLTQAQTEQRNANRQRRAAKIRDDTVARDQKMRRETSEKRASKLQEQKEAEEEMRRQGAFTEGPGISGKDRVQAEQEAAIAISNWKKERKIGPGIYGKDRPVQADPEAATAISNWKKERKMRITHANQPNNNNTSEEVSTNDLACKISGFKTLRKNTVDDKKKTSADYKAWQHLCKINGYKTLKSGASQTREGLDALAAASVKNPHDKNKGVQAFKENSLKGKGFGAFRKNSMAPSFSAGSHAPSIAWFEIV